MKVFILFLILQYLEQRFDDIKIRIFSSVTSIVYHIFLISFVSLKIFFFLSINIHFFYFQSIYTLTLVLSVVMNVNFFILASVLFIIYIIIFIISSKRVKTHTWTNVISILMTCGFIGLILIKGVINFGGFSAIWKINWMNDKIRIPE